MGALRKRFLTVRPEKGRVRGCERTEISASELAMRTSPPREEDVAWEGSDGSTGAPLVEVSYSILVEWAMFVALASPGR